MNIADVLIGSLVFTLASGSSLDLTARMGRSLIAQRQDKERMERIDLELLAAEQALRQAAAQAPFADAVCTDPTGYLVTVLSSSTSGPPLPPGLERRVEVAGERQVRLILRGGGEALDRQRLFTPAAYGLCQGLPAAPTTAGVPS
ncbi:MAG: hypothetical protein WBM08_06945 [Prochlorococcaceae cyanobacterium]